MNANITDPARGGDILQWAQGVTEVCRRFGGVGAANMLTRDGVGGVGFEPLPENRRERRAADALHPWKVFAFAQNEDRDHCFEIHVPEGSLHVGEDAPEVGDLTPVEGQSGRYTLDCEGEIAGEAVIYLAVVREKEDEADGGASPDGEDERPEWQARVVSTPEAVEDAEEVLALLPIARLTIDDSGEYAVGNVEAQYAHSAVAFAPGGATSLMGDGLSYDKIDGEIEVTGKYDSEDETSSCGIEFDTVAARGGEPARVIAKIKNRPEDDGGDDKIWGYKTISIPDPEDPDVNIEVHFLGDDNIDLTKIGKMISSTEVEAVSEAGGLNKLVFHYTDGTSDTFLVANGLNGAPGAQGPAGEAPEITAERQGSHVYIYADGDLIATVEDGATPVITATKTGKVTTIYADGVPIATVSDGADGQGGGEELEPMEVVTDISFTKETGEDGKLKLVANVTKKKIQAVLEDGNLTPTKVTVCDLEDVDVVVKETYDDTETSSDRANKFVSEKKKVTVLGLQSSSPTEDVVFETAPHSEEGA